MSASRFLSPAVEATLDDRPVIYLCGLLPGALKQPTPRQWTGNPWMPVYLALQLVRCAAPRLAAGPGGLLPRLFTLAARCCHPEAVVFCHTRSAVARGFPLERTMPCAARTFLIFHRPGGRDSASGRPAVSFLWGKITKSPADSNDSPSSFFLIRLFLRNFVE